MRVACAQLNPTVGDIRGNMESALRAVERAQRESIDVLLLPELMLTGYPPEDLVLKSHFIDDNLDALQWVAGACVRSTVVGFIDRVEGRLYNAAAVCRDHRVQQVYHKRLLPNYGVFDEERYFEPGMSPGLLDFGGSVLSVTICEDIWVPELAAEDVAEGARVLLNISASPYHLGKSRTREEMLQQRAEENSAWLVYCNMAGGQDELVFDGCSVVISPSSEVIARGSSFGEDFVVVEFSPEGRLGVRERIEEMPGREEEVYRALTTGLRDYVGKNGFSDVVIGLSGGIDSALTATIAADALGPEHVHGVLMPSRYSSRGSVDDSLTLGSALGIDTRTLSIEEAFESFLGTLAPSFEGREPDIAEENLQARVRGTLLMGLSNKFGWLVLATGNKSELSVGYSTLYGDMVGGFAPIKDVFKTRVYDLVRWRNGVSPVIPEDILTKAPSAELRAGQVDQDSLPPYEMLDAILQRYVEEDESVEEIVAAGFDEATVARVARLVDAAEYKRRQGPLGIKITPKAFGKDRRMPVTNRYRG